MTSQPGKQTAAIHILPNISRSKGNQTKKFGLLIKYVTFREQSHTKCGGETITDLFLKIKLYFISRSIVQSFIQFLFVYAKVRAIEIC